MQTFTTIRKGVLFSFKINRTVDKALVSENLKELGGALCNMYYCSSAKQPSSLVSTFGCSYMVWVAYKQGSIAKHVVGAREREGGKDSKAKPHSHLARSRTTM